MVGNRQNFTNRIIFDEIFGFLYLPAVGRCGDAIVSGEYKKVKRLQKETI
jgi:hypothetical protein